MNKLILATLATAITANVAIAKPVAEANGILAASGRTLYRFDENAAGKSNCNGGVRHVVRDAGKRSEAAPAAEMQVAGGYRAYGSAY